jgi:hypothetical protein
MVAQPAVPLLLLLLLLLILYHYNANTGCRQQGRGMAVIAAVVLPPK